MNKDKGSRQIGPLHELLGSALSAVVKAEAMAARATADYIRQVGFGDPPRSSVFPDQLGSLRTVKFSYLRAGPDGVQRPATLEVPLLSLVPIPMLAIREAVLEMAAAVTLKRGPDAAPGDDAAVGFGRRAETDLLATLSTDGEQQGVGDNLKLKVTLEPSDLPTGVSQMLNFMKNAVTTFDQDPGKESP